MNVERAAPHAQRAPYLTARKVSKSYGPIRALKGVSVEFNRAEVHALVGENGAGKSTLKKVLAGETAVDTGTIEIDGRPVKIQSPADARAHGIAVVHQHFPLVEAQTVAQNLHLGDPPVAGPRWLPLVAGREMLMGAREALRPFGLSRIAHRRIRELTVAERQVVAIAKALRGNATIIILDEPTSSLVAAEIAKLFENMRRLREEGACVVFITHSMEEVLEISDRITVLRDGERIATVEAGDADTKSLVQMIVGRELAFGYPKVETEPGPRLLAAHGISLEAEGKVSLDVRSGEVLGLPSLMGSGVERLLQGISGQYPFRIGTVTLDDRDLSRAGISRMIAAGICFVPGDATKEGLIPKLSIEENILLANRRSFTRLGLVRRRSLRALAAELIELLDIRPRDPAAAVENLSGGNRQKVVIAKWLAAGAKLLVMDDPTKGVDVGGKVEIYKVIGDMVSKGRCVMLASTDLDELLGLSDRITVIRDGEVAGSFERRGFDKVAILNCLIGKREHGPKQSIGIFDARA